MRGIIVGTSLYCSELLKQAKEELVETEFGKVPVKKIDNTLVIFRHHGSRPPHRVNHAANISALKASGATELILFASAGSLKPEIRPPCFAVVGDYIHLDPPTFFSSKISHKTPLVDPNLSKELFEAASKHGKTYKNLTYWQAKGPRFETKAEIRMMAKFADLVGMNIASEATLASELDIPVGLICTVDNYGNGVGGATVDQKDFYKAVKANTKKVEAVFKELLK